MKKGLYLQLGNLGIAMLLTKVIPRGLKTIRPALSDFFLIGLKFELRCTLTFSIVNRVIIEAKIHIFALLWFHQVRLHNEHCYMQQDNFSTIDKIKTSTDFFTE